MIVVEYRTNLRSIQNPVRVNRTLAIQLKNALRLTTPVRTGRLRRGWKIKNYTRWGFTLTNGVPYGKYVDGGNTRGLIGRQFVARAQNLIKQRAIAILGVSIDTVYRSVIIYN